MLEILNLKPEVFGLDVSDLSLKIVKLKKTRRFNRGQSLFSLVSLGEEKIKPGIIKKGEIKNEEDLAKIIKEAVLKVKGEKLKTKYVIVSLPEEKAFLQVIQMPRLSEEDLKSAVIYEAENYIPLPIEEVYLDFQIISPVLDHLDHLDVLIAAMPKKIVDSYFSCLKKAGLQPLALEVESLSISRALIKNETADSPVILIDLGQTQTSFIAYSGNSLRLTSSIPVSAHHFTEIISKNLGINSTEAERLKIKYGLAERFKLELGVEETEIKKEKGKIFESLVPVLVDLVQQIRRRLEFYQSHAFHEHLPPNNEALTKVFLCGGGANLKGFPELLSLELKIPVEIGNPLINIPLGEKRKLILPPEEALRYTTALGLALRGLKQ